VHSGGKEIHHFSQKMSSTSTIHRNSIITGKFIHAQPNTCTQVFHHNNINCSLYNCMFYLNYKDNCMELSEIDQKGKAMYAL